MVALQDLAAFTGEREHIKVLKRKKSALSDLLGFSAQGALVHSPFQYVGSGPHPPPQEKGSTGDKELAASSSALNGLQNLVQGFGHEAEKSHGAWHSR